MIKRLERHGEEERKREREGEIDIDIGWRKCSSKESFDPRKKRNQFDWFEGDLK